MNVIVNKCISSGEKFILDKCFAKPQFIYSICGPFTERRYRIKTFEQTGNSQKVYQNKLHKVCFKDDIVYGVYPIY